jgi:UDPglucose 6-dehydrogenase
MGSDPRIGPAFLRAGMGYGGSCFPKDLLAFEQFANGLGYDFPLLREIRRLNDEALDAVYQRVEDALWVLEDKRVALLGLAFKPGTDDVRFSPALALARRLLREGARVVGFDPLASPAVKAEIPEIELASDPYDAATGAHCLVLCTESEDFAKLDLRRLRDLLSQPIIVDGRNMLDPADVRDAGFDYFGVGREAGVAGQGDVEAVGQR